MAGRMAVKMLSTLSGHIKDQFQSQKLSVTGGMVVFSTSILNQVLNKEIFKCPSSSHDIYGWIFMLCPGLTLALLTLLVSQNLSKALTGICQTDKDVPENASGGKRKRTWKFIIRNVFIALCMANIAFLSWVIVTLLATDTLVCIKLGPKPQAEKSVLKEQYDMQSKIAGLVLALVCLVAVLIINLVVKCCFSDLPEKELPSMRRYDQMEAIAASTEFKSLMEKSAKASGKDIVHKFLHACQLQISTEKSPEISNGIGMNQGAEVDTNQCDIFSRDYVEKLRLFLAIRYPRLDGDEQLLYCRHETVPETFDENKVDGMVQKTTHPVCFKTDEDSKPLLQSWDTSCV